MTKQLPITSIPLDTFVDLEGDPYFDPSPGIGSVFRTQAAQLMDKEVDIVEGTYWVRFATAGAGEEDELEFHTHVVPADHLFTLAWD